jgi:hypothetical protein
VLITHDVDEALLLADRVYVLSLRPGRAVLAAEADLARPWALRPHHHRAVHAAEAAAAGAPRTGRPKGRRAGDHADATGPACRRVQRAGGARHFHTVVFGIGPLLLPSLMGGRAVSGRHADLFTDNAAFTPPRDPDRFRLGWRPASRLASC